MRLLFLQNGKSDNKSRVLFFYLKRNLFIRHMCVFCDDRINEYVSNRFCHISFKFTRYLCPATALNSIILR